MTETNTATIPQSAQNFELKLSESVSERVGEATNEILALSKDTVQNQIKKQDELAQRRDDQYESLQGSLDSISGRLTKIEHTLNANNSIAEVPTNSIKETIIQPSIQEQQHSGAKGR
jgi:hypothetical protein